MVKLTSFDSLIASELRPPKRGQLQECATCGYPNAYRCLGYNRKLKRFTWEDVAPGHTAEVCRVGYQKRIMDRF